MDMLAEKMGVDPFEFRYKNLYNDGRRPRRPGRSPEVLVPRASCST